jgi:hypothetical protein
LNKRKVSLVAKTGSECLSDQGYRARDREREKFRIQLYLPFSIHKVEEEKKKELLCLQNKLTRSPISQSESKLNYKIIEMTKSERERERKRRMK